MRAEGASKLVHGEHGAMGAAMGKRDVGFRCLAAGCVEKACVDAMMDDICECKWAEKAWQETWERWEWVWEIMGTQLLA